MSTPLDAAPISTPLEATPAPAPEARTRYGRAVRAPVRYEPIEKVEDDYGSDDYDEDESEIGSGIEYSDSELEAEDDDSDLDGFVVPDRDESNEDDNGSGTDSDSDASSSGVHPTVAGSRAAPRTPARKVPTKVPVRGKKQ